MNVGTTDARPLAKDMGMLACPECGGPAEVQWHTPLSDVPGLDERIEIRCVEPHHARVCAAALAS